MNYILYHKWKFAFGMVCLFVSFAYCLFNQHFLDNALLTSEKPGICELRPLQVFKLEKLERWEEYPAKGDLFTFEDVLGVSSTFLNRELTLRTEPITQERSPSIQLDGWASIEGEIFFVFSSNELNISCVGSVGDFFENLAFSVESFDFKIIENQLDSYSIPLVTILNREFNERVVLTPVSYMEFE